MVWVALDMPTSGTFNSLLHSPELFDCAGEDSPLLIAKSWRRTLDGNQQPSYDRVSVQGDLPLFGSMQSLNLFYGCQSLGELGDGIHPGEALTHLDGGFSRSLSSFLRAKQGIYREGKSDYADEASDDARQVAPAVKEAQEFVYRHSMVPMLQSYQSRPASSMIDFSA